MLASGSQANRTNPESMYGRLIAMLDANHVEYRLIDHSPEGRTDPVSAMRGHPVSQAAKYILVLVKIGKKTKKYVLAVVPGDRKVELAAVKAIYAATYVGFASTDVAERLTGSVAGTILPFSFNSELELIADPSLREANHLYFNARLDRSVALRSADYLRIAKPRLEAIAESRST